MTAPTTPAAGDDGATAASAQLADTLFAELETRVRALRPADDPTPLREAYHFALRFHQGQTRDSGEPYITHPLAVALILTEMNLDQVALSTAILHDTIEDTGARIDDIRKQFGNEVAHCVDGVTKLSKVKMYSVEERQAENIRKMLLAMVTDIRVILVKLADRLHNMRTLGSLSADRKRRIAEETLEIYAPIAHRLGMGKIRAELEDLSFRYSEPEAFADLSEQIESRRLISDEALQQMRQSIAVKLQREGIPARVEGRVKRVYSVWQKLKRQKIGLDQVYDIMGLRIVTDSVKNCYGALGVIHNEWHPIPGRIKDFIAIPRPNLYQSLHTSVIGPGGASFEIQIRTEEMHRIAEEGIAAHWKYKEGKKGPGEDDQRIAWLRQLVEWQREMRDPGEFMATFKVDMYQEEVYCFTPKGRVIILPRDATPVDFAYAIHTDVGHTCVGAKVNGRIVQLRVPLRNGDVVEVLTQTAHQPSKDWLAFVKTSRARNKIRQVIKASERERAIEIGVKAMEREARRLGVALGRVPREELDRVASEHGYPGVDDLQAAVGYGKITARAVLQRFAPEPAAAATPAPATTPPPGGPPRAGGDPGDLTLRVRGADDLLTYRAKCCNPIRGEPIVGYITRGKGVAVHSTNCPNVNNLMYETERRIDVEWARALQEEFRVNLRVYTEDRPGVLNQLTSVLTHENSNIRSLEARSDEKRGVDAAIVEMAVDVRDKKQLERVMAAMRRIPGVRDVERS
ncbi:MAG: bifunctional (p)ppGpp synthetase/guanosine-3',5'-bis(diphosphate) 3'-pyrophosphohydrolase [Bryobacterales bacterium]|nr:bifunctional (p)ppGpp synthetase/guanosine-3',5'-bis(diphosphate) 3'-pyrophosphohydrolase [Bryobacterales bacterium]